MFLLNDSAKLDWLKSRDTEYDTYKAGGEFFPITQLEMDNNPGTIQNPGF